MQLVKIIFLDNFLDVLYFPIWWYSKGLILAGKWALSSVAETENFLGLRIWLANMLRPMFGQYDLTGKIISFFMRIFQIVFRTIALAVFALFYFAVFAIYLLLPIGVFYGIIIHLPGLMKI
jgi:hypothetical protein